MDKSGIAFLAGGIAIGAAVGYAAAKYIEPEKKTDEGDLEDMDFTDEDEISDEEAIAEAAAAAARMANDEEATE
jgi:hypothetical protein